MPVICIVHAAKGISLIIFSGPPASKSKTLKLKIDLIKLNDQNIC